jgi:outer membrane protein OmpA-like peptidoglycan-associated protein
MVKIVYEEASPESTINCIRGCTGYLQTTLTQPLELGEVYEISLWVLYPSTADNLEAEAGVRSNVGFTLSLSAINIPRNDMLETEYSFAGALVFDEWTQIKHHIRALCPLTTITIGLFRNSHFPVTQRSATDDVAYPFFFVDDVLVEKVNADTGTTGISATPFCRFFEKMETDLEVATDQKIALYYASNDHHLDRNNIAKLDSFVAGVDQRWKPLYKVIAHTDNTGSENFKLSDRRLAEVSNHLKSGARIPEFRLIGFSKGSSFPVADNLSQQGRSLNRRVDIEISSLPHSAGIYRQALLQVELGNAAGALEWLTRWLNAVPPDSRILVLFDPRLNELHSHPRWSDLQRRIQTPYAHVEQPRLAFVLDSMFCVDQKHRTLEAMLLGLTGFIQDYDTFNIPQVDATWTEIEHLDSLNTRFILDLIHRNGFPKINDVGRRPVKSVIYHFIHRGDSLLLQEHLPVIRAHCMVGEAEWPDYAMAYDKWLRLRNLPQEYGTQYEFIDVSRSALMLAPLDNLDQVNERRVRLGMSAISHEALTRTIPVQQNQP